MCKSPKIIFLLNGLIGVGLEFVWGYSLLKPSRICELGTRWNTFQRLAKFEAGDLIM